MKISLAAFFNPQTSEQIISASVPADLWMRHASFDILAKCNDRIASYMARLYIKHNRDKIEKFITHPATQKRIAREVQKILARVI